MKPQMLYLIGPPASGKSAAMAAIRNLLGLTTGDWFKIWPTTHDEFRGEPLEDVITGEVWGLSLGVTREGGFSGTDAIGMASSSEALAWLENAEPLPSLILGEGARLGIRKIFAAAAARTDLTVAYLHAPQATLDTRCEIRGSTQKDVFRKGAATRAANAATAAREVGAQVIEINTSWVDPETCAKLILYAFLREPLSL